MISWRILQVLCVFVCNLHRTEARCIDDFKPANWGLVTPAITLDHFAHKITLVNANTFKDVVMCTLGTNIIKGNDVRFLLYGCMNYNQSSIPRASKGLCKEELTDQLSFIDLMCLVAKASNITQYTPVCSHDVVVGLYNRFNEASIATLATTTTKLTTTTTTSTTKSTTAEKSTKTSPPPVTTWSTSSSASSTDSLSPTGDVSWDHKDYAKQKEEKEGTDSRVSYSLLGVSVFMNVVLVFCVVLLWSQRRSNTGLPPSDPQRVEEHNATQSSDVSNHSMEMDSFL